MPNSRVIRRRLPNFTRADSRAAIFSSLVFLSSLWRPGGAEKKFHAKSKTPAMMIGNAVQNKPVALAIAATRPKWPH
jgi:hypothetical protein